MNNENGAQACVIDPGDALRTLATISETLLASYSKLSERAERVEGELGATNAELGRKVAELDATRAHLEAVLQALPNGVIVRDESGTIVRVNGAACSILGCSEQDLLGAATHAGLLGRDARGESREYMRTARERRVIASRFCPIRLPGAPESGSVEIVDDRTELERLTERLHGQSKLVALGNMAGGIAHEIRNPMNAVRGFAELLKRELDVNSKLGRYAGRICDGCDEADQIISSMLTLATPEKLNLEHITAIEMVDAAITSARRVLPRAQAEQWIITTNVQVQGFVGDKIKLRQALRNLVANALQAQPEGGRVHVDVVLDDHDLVLRVGDAGPGIAPQLRRRLGEPFFTTRAEGTGLGLALVHSIAELHGGRLEISRSPAALGGADISVRIPFQPQ